MSCDILSPDVTLQEGVIDEERARSIIKILQENLDEGETEPWDINYLKYPVITKSPNKTNCVTFAFAFAALYGYPCAVIMSTSHCFVEINGKTIEPNQPDYYLYDSIFDYRIDNVDYDWFYIVEEINHNDKEKIRDYFYK
jgi:hypothetical protein